MLLFIVSGCDNNLAVFINNGVLKSTSFLIESDTNLIQNTFNELKWEDVKGASSYEVTIASDASCKDVIFKKEALTKPEINLESLAEGDYFFCIYAVVGKNLIPAGNNGLKLTIDKTPPLVTTRLEVQSYSTPFQIELNIEDKSKVKVLWSQGSNVNPITISDPSALNPTFSASQTGLYNITAEFTDEAGNITKQSFQFYWDAGNALAVNPVFTDLPLAGPIVDGYLNAAEHLTADVIIGTLVASHYTEYKTAVVPVASLCNAAVPYSSTLPLADSSGFVAQGTYRVCVELSNGNSTKTYGSSPTFVYYPHSATVGAVSLIGSASDGYLTLAEHAASTALVSAPVTTGGNSVEYAIVTSVTSCAGPLTYSTSVPKSDDTRFSSSGTFKVCVRAQDAALNPAAYAESSDLIFSSAAPTIASFVAANAASDGYIKDSEKALTADAWVLSASGSASEAYSIPLNDASGVAVCNAGSGYGQSSVVRIVDISSDGTWAICVRLTDSAGNITYGKSAAIVRDIIVPTVGYVATETFDTTPALSGTVSDPTASVTLEINGSTYTATNNGNGTWSVADNLISALPFGYMDVRANVVDLAGNTSTRFVRNGLNIKSETFVSQWKTDNAGTSGSNQITLPLRASGSYNFQINWGDAPLAVTETITAYNAAAVTHTYSVPGTYTVTITVPSSAPTAKIHGWSFFNNGDRLKLLNISMWGPLRLGNDERYFSGAENLTITASDALDLTGTTNMYDGFNGCKSITTIPNIGRWKTDSILVTAGMFRFATHFNDDISEWKTAAVTNMSGMFQDAVDFNSDVSKWDVSHATNLYGMFLGAVAFNQNIDLWNVSSVTNMGAMFNQAEAFNQQLKNWDVSHVTDFRQMFQGTKLFNGDISGWDTSAALNMDSMFRDTIVFDQNIGNWETGNVTTMSGMFANSKAFKQDIGDWDVSKVTNFSDMFELALVFNKDISRWNTGAATQMNMMFQSSAVFNQDISGWNTGNVTNMEAMFKGAAAFNQSVASWSVSKVTNFNQMFMNSIFNHSLVGWNTSAATNMRQMFYNNAIFNSPLNDDGNNIKWDVSNVTDMTEMFRSASSFNQPLNSWNVSAVTKFTGMFQNAVLFNQPLNNWNVQSATDMASMFAQASVFDQNISLWTPTAVQNYERMFSSAVKFNQDISGWNVTAATNMGDMFSGASLFNQNLGSWNIVNVTNMNGMFYNLTLSVANYNALLTGWAAKNVRSGVNFHGGNSKYSAGSAAATARVTTLPSKGWTITDSGAI